MTTRVPSRSPAYRLSHPPTAAVATAIANEMDDMRHHHHVLMLPFPLQGHINAFLTLAKLLAPLGCTFSVAVPYRLGSQADGDARPKQELQTQAPVRIVRLQQAPMHSKVYDDNSDDNGIEARPGTIIKKLLFEMETMRDVCEQLIFRLKSSEPISCMVTDSFVTWSQELANQFKIQNFIFFTGNAHTFALYLHTPSLIQKGLLPIADFKQKFDGLDGLPPLVAYDFPMSIREFPQFVAKQVERVSDAKGIIFNTVEDFEREPLKAIQKVATVYPIGPILEPLEKAAPSPSSSSSSLSRWAEDRRCLSWLDSIPAGSVLYVSFGSLATMSSEQIRELAEGLDLSGVLFLWVIRPDVLSPTDERVLPESFMDRTCGRGMVISWAPQRDVLAHAAIGGFMTHCGWNSITENLSSGGVPMICWPHVAEQRTNAKILAHEWHIGLDLLQGEEGLVRRDVIEKAIRELMQGDIGKELGREASRFKDITVAAVKEGGSSHKYLSSLAKHMHSIS